MAIDRLWVLSLAGGFSFIMAGLGESVDSLRIRDARADQHDGEDSADVRLGSVGSQTCCGGLSSTSSLRSHDAS